MIVGRKALLVAIFIYISDFLQHSTQLCTDTISEYLLKLWYGCIHLLVWPFVGYLSRSLNKSFGWHSSGLCNIVLNIYWHDIALVLTDVYSVTFSIHFQKYDVSEYSVLHHCLFFIISFLSLIIHDQVTAIYTYCFLSCPVKRIPMSIHSGNLESIRS